MTDTLSAAELASLAVKAAKEVLPWSYAGTNSTAFLGHVVRVSHSGIVSTHYDSGFENTGTLRWVLSAPLTPENTLSVSTLARALLASAVQVDRAGTIGASWYVARIGRLRDLNRAERRGETKAEARNALLDALLPESPEVTQ